MFSVTASNQNSLLLNMDQVQRLRRKNDAFRATRSKLNPIYLARRLRVLLVLGSASTSAGLLPTTRRRHHHPPFRSSPSITRRFVLTTPEAIIEKASTTKLLDDLIDESVRTSARRPIMMQFDPSSGWIWKRWKGTVFSETWDSCVYRMLYASAVFLLCRSFPQIKDALSGFSILWGQLLSVTTFTLTFFVNQSYALWRKCSELSRRLQGRLHDMDLTLAAHATRRPPTAPNEPSTYTAESRQILELVSRYVRLFNLLTYASFTRSHRPVLTPRGMRRLVERGLMTPLEREVLVNAQIPATQRHNAVLLWIIRAFIEGKAAGHFTGDAGFEQQFIEKAHVCRASYGGIGDELQGRMPFAYAHIVQVLVDLVLAMYPFMAYSAGMSGFLCVLGTGLLTIGYQGLFDLAKQFLDPYDNENYGKGEDPLVVDTLIAETNAGSVRWLNGLAEMPVSSQKIKDGELSEYLLPLRGYSVDELMQMKEEKRLQQEKREREELERMQKEEQEQRVRQAAEAMIPAQLDIISSATSTDFDVPYFIIYNNTGDRAKVPSVLKVASFPTAESVCAVLVSQNSNATSLRESLIPAGTAPASAYVEKIEVAAEVAKAEPEKLAEIQEEPKRTLFGGEEIGDIAYDYDGDEDDAFKVLQDWGADTVYVHKFDSFDPYLDLPSYDEIGPDGKEVRLSQLLADEEWEEEIEAAKEKATIRTYEEYIKRVGELKSAEEIEMLETQEILQAPAYARGAGEWLVKDLPDFGKYDQTKLDGISQLFGLPPNELSGIPGYVEPSVPPTGFDSISQLWDSSNIWADESTKVSPPEGDDGVFHGMSELWGVDLDNEAVDMASSANRLVVASGDGTDSSLRLTKPSIDVSRSRLSQILADEDWATEEEPPPSIEHPFTFADYEKQVQDILEAEKKELLETQAILNARPGADGIEVLEKERKVVLKVMNSTDAEDDLAVLERDAREDPSIIAQILEEEDEELLETQAILNARPGADEIEVPEKDTLSVSKLLKSTDPEDSLAVLEMDAPGYLKKFKSNANANASVPDLSTEMVESASVEEGDDTACHSVHEKGENATHAPSSSAQKGNEP